MNCPGCGAGEAVTHAPDCLNRPLAFRSCCSTPLWREGPSPHRDECPEWGVGPTIRARIERLLDPWWDVAW